MLWLLCIGQSLLIGIVFGCKSQASRRNIPTGRSASGYPATIEEAPYQVQVQLQNANEKWVVICGAAILRRDIILTAGHCLDASDENLRVLSGSAKKGSGTFHAIAQHFVHEKYADGNNDYDIAIARVDPPFQFDQFTRPIDLAKVEPNFGDIATVSGWASAYVGLPSLTNSLRKFNATIIEKQVCDEKYVNAFNYTLNGDRVICYGPHPGSVSEDTCFNEGGDPLVVDGKLVGLSSGISLCEKPDSPRVATDVVKFSPWIKEKLKMLSK